MNPITPLYLHKLPDTEWVGFESIYHGADDGVATV